MDQGFFIGLLHKRLSGDLSREDTDRLKTWLDDSREHGQLAERVEQAWELSDTYEPSFQPNVERGLSKLKQRIAAEKAQSSSPLRVETATKARFGWIYRAAAIAAVAVIGAFGIWQSAGWSDTGVSMEQYASAENRKNLELEDGSGIVLNKHTQITYPSAFDKDKREVQLKGEAFFDIAKDSQRPFSIDLDGAKVIVLGTAFNIRSLEDENTIELTVEHGKVAFTTADGSIRKELTKGQQLIYQRTEGAYRLSKDPQLNSTAWKRDRLNFVDAALPEVIHYLENYYDVSIQLVNPELQNCRFNANYNNTPLSEALDILKATYDLKISQEGQKEFILSAGNCKLN